MALDFGTIASLGSAYLGYKGAKQQADITKQNNALLEAQYDWEKQKQAPIVSGAQNALESGFYVDANGNPISQEDYDALSEADKGNYSWQSQFQPFVDAGGRSAVGATNIADQYLGATPQYQQAGLEGVGKIQELAAFGPQQQQELASAYGDPYAQSIYRMTADDINRSAADADRQTALEQGRFGALSTQKGRKDALTEAARIREIMRAGNEIGSDAYRYGQDAGARELQRLQGLANTNIDIGNLGLSNATSGFNLSQAGVNAGVASPFTPYRQYASTIQGTQVAAPQLQTPNNAALTGLGTGLQTWNLFNPSSGG